MTTIFRTDKHVRKPWRVRMDGCILSGNWRTKADAQRFLLRLERYTPFTTAELLKCQRVSATLEEKVSIDQELRRRSDLAKFAQRANRDASRINAERTRGTNV